jgi:signal transduction histidine kinase
VILILSILCIILGLHLFSLKRGIRNLRKDFQEIKENRRAERHLNLSIPDRELELLAVEINEYITCYYQEIENLKNNSKEIRREITHISHDLRTPLTSILGYMELLYDEHMTEEQKESYQVIHRRCYQLSDLVEQLYDYARLGNQEFYYEMERLDLYRILQEHLLSFYPEFERKNIELEPIFPQTVKPLWIKGDGKCLERVLTNQTSNTLKYSEGEAKVILKEEKKYICLTYQTKRGDLSEYDIAHMFDRFYTKEGKQNTRQSSGLGLAITRLFVEQMGGSIEAHGDPEYLYICCRFSHFS